MCALAAHSPSRLGGWLGGALLLFYLGLRWGLFSSVHSFVVAGRGAGQSALLALFLAVLGPGLGRGLPRPRPRPSGVSLSLAGGVALASLVFVDDSLGPTLGSAWLRPALWALLLAYGGPAVGRALISPLPLCLGWLASLGWPRQGLCHFFFFLGLGVAGLFGAQHFCAETPLGGASLSLVCREPWLSAWSEVGGRPLSALLGVVSYEHTLPRLNTAFLRRLGVADVLQQSVAQASGLTLSLSGGVLLIEALLGLGLGLGLALLLGRKAP